MLAEGTRPWGATVITEPEMTGGFGEEHPATGREFASADVLGGDHQPVRRPWTWAVGGVALASVLWATGLYVYHHGQHDGPALHGYHLGQSPCSGFALQPLTDAIGDRAPGATPAGLTRGAVLDRTRCGLTAKSTADGWTVTYDGTVTADLHKKTDPRSEFEDQRRFYDDTVQPAESVLAVPGLGDRAYLLTISDQSRELKVLHGGLVLTLTVSSYATWVGPGIPEADNTEPPLPEVSRLQPALLQTARQIMIALRS